MFLTTKALVLREVKYKEADKILTVLTEREGKLTVKARGALRKGCKYGAAAQALCFSEMTLFGNAGKWSINEAETIEQFLELRSDISALALASYFAELLEAVSDEDSPTHPSTEKQLRLAEHLAAELSAMGLSGVRTDRGYVYAHLPEKDAPGAPAIGFIAHIDTSPEAADAPIRPREIRYEGGDVTLDAERDIRLSPQGVRFCALETGELCRVSLDIPGMFSVYNALAALSWSVLRSSAEAEWESCRRQASARALRSSVFS